MYYFWYNLQYNSNQFFLNFVFQIQIMARNRTQIEQLYINIGQSMDLKMVHLLFIENVVLRIGPSLILFITSPPYEEKLGVIYVNKYCKYYMDLFGILSLIIFGR